MPDKVWIASTLQESTYWEAFAVYADPETAIKLIDIEDRADRQRLLDRHDSEYPPELNQRGEIAMIRSQYLILVEESILWDVQRDQEGNIIECYGDPQGYGTTIQIAPYEIKR